MRCKCNHKKKVRNKCQMSPETVMHVVRDCEQVQNFWAPLINPEQFSRFFSLGLDG